jgi:SAM-dependent methyltransferase
MSDTGVTETAKAFYERYPFPGNRPVDQDGLILLRMLTESVNRRSREHPARPLRILDAGCGTGNTSIALARRFPGAAVTGIDQSSASLLRARTAGRALGLENLEFQRRDLMRLPARWKPFDIILCLGVLHHTADMKKGLINLRRILRDDGELYLWIYGKHGRYRHALNVRVLSLLQSAGDSEADPVRLARDLIRHSGRDGVMKDLLGNLHPGALEQRAFDDPVWIADQFLNPHEILLDLSRILRLAAASGLSVDRVVGMDETAARRFLPPSLLERFVRLSPRRRLVALDLLMKPERYFIVLRSRHPSMRARQ